MPIAVSDRRKTRRSVEVEMRRTPDRRKYSRKEGDTFADADRKIFLRWFNYLKPYINYDSKGKKLIITSTLTPPVNMPPLNAVVKKTLTDFFRMVWKTEVDFKKGKVILRG